MAVVSDALAGRRDTRKMECMSTNFAEGKRLGSNIEIKARVSDFRGLMARVEAIADSGPVILRQEDTFFRCENGRLKLRELSLSRSELIFYKREDNAEPCQSRYDIVQINDPDAVGTLLGRALGVLGTVRKERTLFMVGQTRIHVDCVDGLGRFLELEVVLSPGQSEDYGKKVALGLMKELEIRPTDLVVGSYIDLLK